MARISAGSFFSKIVLHVFQNRSLLLLCLYSKPLKSWLQKCWINIYKWIFTNNVCVKNSESTAQRSYGSFFDVIKIIGDIGNNNFCVPPNPVILLSKQFLKIQMLPEIHAFSQGGNFEGDDDAFVPCVVRLTKSQGPWKIWIKHNLTTCIWSYQQVSSGFVD